LVPIIKTNEAKHMFEQNLIAAWAGILLGMLSGAIVGLRFHNDDFLGGYRAWPRRLVRLGHISFFGLAIVNFAFFFTMQWLAANGTAVGWLLQLSSWSLVAGAVAMPTVCFLSAWKKPMRHFFFVPVSLLVAGVISLNVGGLLR
jgi:hypothetical protein